MICPMSILQAIYDVLYAGELIRMQLIRPRCWAPMNQWHIYTAGINLSVKKKRLVL
jgi:hypothetical protein